MHACQLIHGTNMTDAVGVILLRMDKNSSEEWLILILVGTVDKAPTLQKIFERTDEFKSHHDVLNIA